MPLHLWELKGGAARLEAAKTRKGKGATNCTVSRWTRVVGRVAGPRNKIRVERVVLAGYPGNQSPLWSTSQGDNDGQRAKDVLRAEKENDGRGDRTPTKDGREGPLAMEGWPRRIGPLNRQEIML